MKVLFHKNQGKLLNRANGLIICLCVCGERKVWGDSAWFSPINFPLASLLFLSVGIKLYFIPRQEPFVLYLLPVRTEMIREHKCRLLVDIVSVLHWHWGLSLIGISREKFKSLSVVTRKNQILCPTSPVSPVLMDLIKSSLADPTCKMVDKM